MNRIKIIINADDLGISTEVNDKIFALIEAGKLTSTTLLANGPAFNDAINRLRLYSSISVGVHLNCMEFKPISTRNFRSLVNSEGLFDGRLFEVKLEKTMKNAIEAEWLLQIEKVREAGIQISHIDSHFHSHTHPDLLFTINNVVRKSGVRRIRTTKNIYSTELPPASRKLIIKKWLWHVFCRQMFRFKTTDGFCELDTFISCLNQNRVQKKTVEIMTHPGSKEYPMDEILLQSDKWSELCIDRLLVISYYNI